MKAKGPMKATLFALAALAARPLLRDRHWRGFVLGYAGHLVGDLYAGGRVPWFAPFEPLPRQGKKRLNLPAALMEELAGAAFLCWRFQFALAETKA